MFVWGEQALASSPDLASLPLSTQKQKYRQVITKLGAKRSKVSRLGDSGIFPFPPRSRSLFTMSHVSCQRLGFRSYRTRTTKRIELHL